MNPFAGRGVESSPFSSIARNIDVVCMTYEECFLARVVKAKLKYLPKFE